jgi:hypothetical protein
MKRIMLVLLALLCLTLCACTPKNQYVDNVLPSALANNIVAEIGTSEDYMSADVDHYEFYFGEHKANAKVVDCAIMFSRAETDVNEFGIFRAETTADATAVREMVQTYLNDQTANLRSFAANYSPDDMAKIDNAGIEVYGCYVVYYILDAEDETAVLNAIKQKIIVEK